MLTRRTQIAAKAENLPGEEVTSFATADVVQVLDAEINESREKIDRNPAQQTLDNPVMAMGSSSVNVTFNADMRGGVSNQQPDYDLILQACGLESTSSTLLTLGTGGLNNSVKRGDVIFGQTSGAVGIAEADAAAAAGTLSVAVISGTFQAEDIDNINQSQTSTGTVASVASNSGTTNYAPRSTAEVTIEHGGSWSSGAPSKGDAVTFSLNSVIKGAGIVVSDNSTTLVFELAWGTLDASDTITAPGSSTETVSSITGQTAIPTITIRQNRHNLIRAAVGCRGTFGFSADAGNPYTLSFDLLGKKGTHTDGDFITAPTRNTKLAPQLRDSADSQVTFAPSSSAASAAEFPVTSVEFSMNNEVGLRGDGNESEGTFAAFITARNPTLTITMHQQPSGTVNWDSIWAAGTLYTIVVAADGGSDNNWVLLCPTAQLVDMSDGDDNGHATHTLTFELRGQKGDDEFTLLYGAI